MSQKADQTTPPQRSKDDDTVCTGSTSSRGSVPSPVDATSSNGEDLASGSSIRPHITLSRGGPLICFLRQVPLGLLVGGMLTVSYSTVGSFTLFSILLLCFNLIIFCNWIGCGFYGLIGTTFTIPSSCSRDWNRESDQMPGLYDVQHYVIVPNYKEDINVLEATIQAIADSPIARRCIRVVLAMEAREPDVQKKARQLEEKWSNSFLELFSTMHPPDLPMEVAGKSSNTAWAFAEVSTRARVLRLNPRRTVISVNDADCLWHPNYFQAVSLDVCRLGEEATAWMIWQAPQMQLRNHFNVPVLTKFTGMASALMEISGLRCPYGIHICFSSYTMMLDMADHVGGWDADVIAEDHHMFTKCFFASMNEAGARLRRPRLKLQPVFLPVKSFMVESEEGSNTLTTYFASLQARFVQARRHSQGTEEIAYVLLQWVETIRFWGVLRVPCGIHFGTARLLWTMLCTHAWPYLHWVTVVLANIYVLRRIYGVEAMKGPLWGFVHLPMQSCALVEGWMHLHCIVFMSFPWLFLVSTLTNALGHFAVVDLFIRRGANMLHRQQDVECSDGKALLEADVVEERSRIWYAEQGGSPGCPMMRWWGVVLVQASLETMFVSMLVVIVFGFIPTLLAVWNIAIGVHFSYRTASKPVGPGMANKTQMDKTFPAKS